MRTTTMLVAAALMATAATAPVANADPPGTIVQIWDWTQTRTDHKDGTGIYDPLDANNPCTFLLLGLRVSHLPSSFGKPDITTNANGPIVGVSEPLDVSTGVTCPLPGSPPSPMWLRISGFNVHSAEAAMSITTDLCTQKVQTLGCFPDLASQHVLASACDDWSTTVFDADYFDGKGDFKSDILQTQSDEITVCNERHTHNYTGILTSAGANFADSGFDRIKVEDVVHSGSGTTYMAVCVEIDYTNLDSNTVGTAEGHTWHLVLDLDDPAGPANWVNAIQAHFGPGVGLAERGVDSHADNKDFGPCENPLPDDDKKPAPIV